MMQKKLTFNEPEIELETMPLVRELRKKIEELEDRNQRLAYENLTLRDNAMYFEKRFYESVVTYENAMNQLQKYIAEMDSNKSNRYVIVDADSMDLAMKLTKVTEERDAAVEKVNHYAGCWECDKREKGECSMPFYKNECDEWEWRGPQKEE